MKRILLALMGFFCASCLQAQPIKLSFWYSLTGDIGEQIKVLVKDFNQSQNEYVIQPIYKGDYYETLTSFAASYRAHQPPAIVQIFEVGTAIMLAPKGIIKPVDELMAEQGMSLPKDDFIQSVREFYSREGVLMAMPFNLSAPVMYYNADLLAKLNYTSANFPQTWAEMEVLALKLKKAGVNCTYTTAYPGWVLYESFLAIQGLSILKSNPLHVAQELPGLERHFRRLQKWQQLGYFRYGGRVDEATMFFTSGVCPLFSQSSGAYRNLSTLVPFHVGVAAMPLDTELSKVRYANVAGGAALWAVGGLTKEQYRGIAKFFAFIAQPQTQKTWHEQTGYLPIGLKGIYSALVKSSSIPVLRIVQKDLEADTQAFAMKSLGPQNQIRRINDEVLESLFAGQLNAKQAVHESLARTKHIVERFKRNTKA